MMNWPDLSDSCSGISPTGAVGCTLFRGHHEQGQPACRNAGGYTGKDSPRVAVVWCNWCGVEICERHSVSPPITSEQLEKLWNGNLE